MISKKELTMGRDNAYPQEYTKEIDQNITVLQQKMNIIRARFGKPMTVTSGWRPKSINEATSNAGKNSKHMLGMACDISDVDGDLWKWCLENLELMQELGIYLEDRRWTPSWVHFGIGAPSSGRRIFIPNNKRPLAPEAWDGIYDKKFDLP